MNKNFEATKLKRLQGYVCVHLKQVIFAVQYSVLYKAIKGNVEQLNNGKSINIAVLGNS
jgi:hypothetical protein